MDEQYIATILTCIIVVLHFVMKVVLKLLHLFSRKRLRLLRRIAENIGVKYFNDESGNKCDSSTQTTDNEEKVNEIQCKCYRNFQWDSVEVGGRKSPPVSKQDTICEETWDSFDLCSLYETGRLGNEFNQPREQNIHGQTVEYLQEEEYDGVDENGEYNDGVEYVDKRWEPYGNRTSTEGFHGSECKAVTEYIAHNARLSSNQICRKTTSDENFHIHERTADTSTTVCLVNRLVLLIIDRIVHCKKTNNLPTNWEQQEVRIVLDLPLAKPLMSLFCQLLANTPTAFELFVKNRGTSLGHVSIYPSSIRDKRMENGRFDVNTKNEPHVVEQEDGNHSLVLPSVDIRAQVCVQFGNNNKMDIHTDDATESVEDTNESIRDALSPAHSNDDRSSIFSDEGYGSIESDTDSLTIDTKLENDKDDTTPEETTTTTGLNIGPSGKLHGYKSGELIMLKMDPNETPVIYVQIYRNRAGTRKEILAVQIGLVNEIRCSNALGQELIRCFECRVGNGQFILLYSEHFCLKSILIRITPSDQLMHKIENRYYEPDVPEASADISLASEPDINRSLNMQHNIQTNSSFIGPLDIDGMSNVSTLPHGDTGTTNHPSVTRVFQEFDGMSSRFHQFLAAISNIHEHMATAPIGLGNVSTSQHGDTGTTNHPPVTRVLQGLQTPACRAEHGEIVNNSSIYNLQQQPQLCTGETLFDDSRCVKRRHKLPHLELDFNNNFINEDERCPQRNILQTTEFKHNQNSWNCATCLTETEDNNLEMYELDGVALNDASVLSHLSVDSITHGMHMIKTNDNSDNLGALSIALGIQQSRSLPEMTTNDENKNRMENLPDGETGEAIRIEEPLSDTVVSEWRLDQPIINNRRLTGYLIDLMIHRRSRANFRQKIRRVCLLPRGKHARFLPKQWRRSITWFLLNWKHAVNEAIKCEVFNRTGKSPHPVRFVKSLIEDGQNAKTRCLASRKKGRLVTSTRHTIQTAMRGCMFMGCTGARCGVGGCFQKCKDVKLTKTKPNHARMKRAFKRESDTSHDDKTQQDYTRSTQSSTILQEYNAYGQNGIGKSQVRTSREYLQEEFKTGQSQVRQGVISVSDIDDRDQDEIESASRYTHADDHVFGPDKAQLNTSPDKCSRPFPIPHQTEFMNGITKRDVAEKISSHLEHIPSEEFETIFRYFKIAYHCITKDGLICKTHQLEDSARMLLVNKAAMKEFFFSKLRSVEVSPGVCISDRNDIDIKFII